MDIRFQPQVRKLVKEGREVSRDDWLSLTEDNHLTSLDTFRRRLDRALGDLGRVDINLKTALDKLSTDLSRNNVDGLPNNLSEQMEADLTAAIGCLADALVRARDLTDEVGARTSARTQ